MKKVGFSSIYMRQKLRLIFALYHWLWSVLGKMLYGNPSKNMTVIGVTGTNGKSTVVDLITAIFEESGYKTASMSSLRIKIGGNEWKNELKMTMPGRAFIQRFLRKAKKQGASHAVIEITSEGIKQFRHKGIDFDAAVFTNLSPEHIESHGGFEKYRAAKEKLFLALSKSPKPKRVAVINGDDPNAEYFLKYDADEKWIYTKNSKFQITNSKLIPNLKIFKIQNYKLDKGGIEIEIEGKIIKSPLLGEFNIENILAAIAVSRGLDIGWDFIQRAIEKIKCVPGRLEFVDEGQNFKVIIDYAHTPDSLKKVYENLVSILRPRSLICVFGAAGGGRDKWKRPEMGKIASQYCQKTIITNEDPYDENPDAIMNEIAAGLFQGVDYEKILDRKEAIKKAIKSAGEGDAIVMTGKGAESWIMGYHGSKIPWDDREIAREVLKAREKF